MFISAVFTDFFPICLPSTIDGQTLFAKANEQTNKQTNRRSLDRRTDRLAENFFGRTSFTSHIPITISNCKLTAAYRCCTCCCCYCWCCCYCGTCTFSCSTCCCICHCKFPFITLSSLTTLFTVRTATLGFNESYLLIGLVVSTIICQLLLLLFLLQQL